MKSSFNSLTLQSCSIESSVCIIYYCCLCCSHTSSCRLKTHGKINFITKLPTTSSFIYSFNDDDDDENFNFSGFMRQTQTNAHTHKTLSLLLTEESTPEKIIIKFVLFLSIFQIGQSFDFNVHLSAHPIKF
jgi:hypothetical protein